MQESVAALPAIPCSCNALCSIRGESGQCKVSFPVFFGSCSDTIQYTTSPHISTLGARGELSDGVQDDLSLLSSMGYRYQPSFRANVAIYRAFGGDIGETF